MVFQNNVFDGNPDSNGSKTFIFMMEYIIQLWFHGLTL